MAWLALYNALRTLSSTEYQTSSSLEVITFETHLNFEILQSIPGRVGVNFPQTISIQCFTKTLMQSFRFELLCLAERITNSFSVPFRWTSWSIPKSLFQYTYSHFLFKPTSQFTNKCFFMWQFLNPVKGLDDEVSAHCLRYEMLGLIPIDKKAYGAVTLARSIFSYFVGCNVPGVGTLGPVFVSS